MAKMIRRSGVAKPLRLLAARLSQGIALRPSQVMVKVLRLRGRQGGGTSVLAMSLVLDVNESRGGGHFIDAT
ncbi:MAG: hypothetical protein U0939_21295 [Pirellulales bacterium]